MYMGIYTSEIFALESKAELEGSMPGLGWNLEEVYHHEIRRAYPPKGDAVIRRLISLNSVRNETPKRLMPYQYQNPEPEKHVPIFGMPRPVSKTKQYMEELRKEINELCEEPGDKNTANLRLITERRGDAAELEVTHDNYDFEAMAESYDRNSEAFVSGNY